MIIHPDRPLAGVPFLAVAGGWGRGAIIFLDLDLILLGDTTEESPGLRVPHPRFRDRFFVLGPLAEVAPEMVDPVTGLRVWELLRNLLQDEKR